MTKYLPLAKRNACMAISKKEANAYRIKFKLESCQQIYAESGDVNV